MAAVGSVSINAFLLGLGKDLSFIDRFTLTDTPAKSTMNYREQAVADTEEVLDLGNVATVDQIVIKAITNDLTIDPSFDTTYREGILVKQGHVAAFTPVGTVKVKNADAAEQVTYEFMVIGR